MLWNWQLPNWPQFNYDPGLIVDAEKRFLLGAGSFLAYLKSIGDLEHKQFIVEILSLEGLESSKIEGELLDRQSLQSSVKRHFGLQTDVKESQPESGIAKLLCHVYESFDQPLTHEMLWTWHAMLLDGSSLTDLGKYRTHEEPMHIVSSRSHKIFFEAPPSLGVPKEMAQFIEWFNAPGPSVLGKAAIAHVYFESIHPFEDGNGRIGRALVEKVLSQGIGQPLLVAVSKVLEKRKKEYYAALERCNRTLDVHHWVQFFVEIILQAQEYSGALLSLLVEKAKMFRDLAGALNPRQEKALLRMFAEGLGGFKGGLSAENYIAITKTSRATATRDLADLVAKGALVKTGELRHTRYWLNLGLPFIQRPV